MAHRRRTLDSVAGTYTRVAPDVRRMQILEATHRVTLERGLHDVRVGDVADELSVSTGTIHYHFATKDELIESMLREMARREIADMRRSLTRLDAPEDRLALVIDTYLPSPRHDHTWVLWIDVWGEALRHASLRQISEELDNAWVELLAEVIADGVATGAFRCDDPVATVVAAVRAARRSRPAGRAAPGDDDEGADERPRPPRRRARARLRAAGLKRRRAPVASVAVQFRRLLAVDRWSIRTGG